MAGSLAIVGLGPGDPELITRKAARLIGEADVVAYHAGVRKQSHARRIAADLIPTDAVEEELRYPVTTGTTDHPGGYVGALADFYEESAERLTTHLTVGRRVVLLAEGDPLFYGSSMYLHDRLAPRFATEVVPGVPAYAAATAAVATPLVRQADVLTVLPGTLPEPELARRLADTDGAVIMKLGRTFPAVRRALAEAGRLDGALYVERAAQPEQRWLPVADVDPDSVPYFSLIVVPGDSAASPSDATRLRHRVEYSPSPAESSLVATPVLTSSPSSRTPVHGGATTSADSTGNKCRLDEGKCRVNEVVVVGLGPGPEAWLTPEAREVLAEVEHVVGYGPYVARVPQRAGLQRHASGNTVEVDRARHALDLAAAGERVAVVSGGDAGVFGMAAAVFEAAADPAYADVGVRVVPGVSAIQAVAARAGAPIGADFAVMSLSDRLKPWSVIADRLRAIAEADLVLGLYNPASRSRRQQVVDAQKLLLEHRSPDTVVVVGRDVGRAEEELTVTTLSALDTDTIDMKCLLLVGASTTRVDPAGVWTPRWVEDTTEAAP
ncbi:precorrin-3B C(17)-methyltransferase [Nocardioides panacisoli]|uniref:precorrin-3B C(17)-methyltransferase n=1 Tax=Nocardioides panacisoli TaxID=627624 RepID=UPI001C635E47|nr:precorrin-3B C(17)-methyltransferase [Nocardioides panacisoli]QYJ05466.1 precorrin-3B C(17)-methyltransferase [Nocardioides panacisoli]